MNNKSMADRQKSKQARDLIPNFKKKMDEIDDLIEISPELDQKMLKLISNTTTTKQALKFNDYWLCLVNKIGAKTRNIILFFRINNFSYNPFILIATLIIIVISLGSYYLVYRKQTNIIANQETPRINLNPSSSPILVVTPSPVETISPNIAKSSNNKENNQTLIAKRSIKLRKPEEPKNLYKESDKIADNTRNGNHINITSNRTIKTVYIGYLGEIEEVEGIYIILKSALKDNGFELFNSENIGIDKADVAITTIKEIDEEYIILTDKHDKIFFKRKTADLASKSTEEKTTIIIEELERYASSLKSKKQN